MGLTINPSASTLFACISSASLSAISTINEFLVEEKGFKAFHREILRLCRSKGECSYWETKLQFDNNVLFRDDYYNEIIHCRINAKHLS